jgi:hypothetical protein
MLRRWYGAVVVGLGMTLTAACLSQPVVTPRPYGAAGAGGVIDKENRWRGAPAGAALGGVLGGSVTEISSRAARESLAYNQTVAYQTTDGWQRVEAAPRGSSGRSGCREVRERVYQDNRLVREQIREIC